MSKQPRDDSNYPIPVLGYRPFSGQSISFIPLTSYRSTEFSPSVRVISIYSTASCFLEVGNSTVEANSSNSHYIPAGIYMDISLGSDVNAKDTNKYISIFSLDEGTIYISERE